MENNVNLVILISKIKHIPNRDTFNPKIVLKHLLGLSQEQTIIINHGEIIVGKEIVDNLMNFKDNIYPIKGNNVGGFVFEGYYDEMPFFLRNKIDESYNLKLIDVTFVQQGKNELIELYKNDTKITLTAEQLYNIILITYQEGYKSYEPNEAGLEPFNPKSYTEHQMNILIKKQQEKID